MGCHPRWTTYLGNCPTDFGHYLRTVPLDVLGLRRFHVGIGTIFADLRPFFRRKPIISWSRERIGGRKLLVTIKGFRIRQDIMVLSLESGRLKKLVKLASKIMYYSGFWCFNFVAFVNAPSFFLWGSSATSQSDQYWLPARSGFYRFTIYFVRQSLLTSIQSFGFNFRHNMPSKH